MCPSDSLGTNLIFGERERKHKIKTEKMRKILMLLAAVPVLAVAQNKKKQDVAAIKGMCGCYEVTFNFAETFSPREDYEFHENYRAGALEYVLPVEESKDKIVLQHLLIVGDTMIIKHWRQDWLYENEDLYVFDKENTWKYNHQSSDDVKGQWTQKVYQVDDSPRYEGSSSWVHVDGRDYWENTADAPLPRREHTKRSDYNVMTRVNHQEITAYGWVHEQDNGKVIRETDDEVLVNEKGWNTYERTDERKCQVAKDWWAKNQMYWADVRAVWDEVFATKKTVAINMKVDDKVLFQRLFALGDEVRGQAYDSAETKEAIRAIIRMHLKDQKLLASQ